MTTDTGHRVSLLRSFDELRAQAPALLQPHAQADLYATAPWFENLSAHGIEPPFERRLLLVRRGDGTPVLCLPLLLRPQGAAAVYGALTTSLSNYYSSLYGPIGDPAQITPEALRAAVAFLRRQCGSSAVVDLQPLDTGHPFYGHMLDALEREGYATDTYLCFGNWHLDVAGRSYDAYEPSLPSRLRNTIKRGRKKLDQAGPWSLRIHREPGPDTEQAIADFEHIYNRSWKVPEPFPHFVGGLCRTAAAQGWLRLGVVRLEDRPIASQLWIVKDRMALIYKLAYDEEYKRFSAGSVLSAAMMRDAIDVDGAVDVDYLTGDDGYKVDWMSHRRERRGIVAFDLRSPQGLVSWARHRLGKLRRPPAPAPAPVVAAGDDAQAP